MVEFAFPAGQRNRSFWFSVPGCTIDRLTQSTAYSEARLTVTRGENMDVRMVIFALITTCIRTWMKLGEGITFNIWAMCVSDLPSPSIKYGKLLSYICKLYRDRCNLIHGNYLILVLTINLFYFCIVQVEYWRWRSYKCKNKKLKLGLYNETRKFEADSTTLSSTFSQLAAPFLVTFQTVLPRSQRRLFHTEPCLPFQVLH